MEVADLPNAEVRLNVSFFQTDEENVNLLPSDDPSSIPREDFEYGDPEFEIVTEKLYEVCKYDIVVDGSNSSSRKLRVPSNFPFQKCRTPFGLFLSVYRTDLLYRLVILLV